MWSEPGQGSRFRIYLPQAPQPPVDTAVPAAAPAAAHTKAHAGARRILVVEDQDEVRGFATEVLRSCGYQVVEASSGDEAMRLFERPEPIDLLLTDVVLHGMNGRELAERFVRVFPDAGVLFTSGYPDDVTARKGVPRGSVAFLPKPYSPEALTSRVAELLKSAAA